MKRFFLSFLPALLFFTVPLALGQQAQSPLIAVAAERNVASAPVSDALGPNPFFLLFDARGRLLETASNAYKDAGNTPSATADFLVSKGARVVVAQTFAPNMAGVMNDKGMQVFAFRGTAQGAAQKLLTTPAIRRALRRSAFDCPYSDAAYRQATESRSP